MDTLAAAAGPDEEDSGGVSGTRVELRAEGGRMLFRLLLRGLCLFEFILDGGAIRQTLPFPAHAQNVLGGESSSPSHA